MNCHIVKNSGSVIVSWDFSHRKDKSILLVGERENGKMNIVNAFQGEKAEEIYKLLTTIDAKGEKNNG